MKKLIVEADEIDEGFFNSIKSLFNPTSKKVSALKKGQETLRAIISSIIEMEEVSRRRGRYLDTLLSSLEREIDEVIFSLENKTKAKRVKRLYFDDMY